jgi:hypothetical protein
MDRDMSNPRILIPCRICRSRPTSRKKDVVASRRSIGKHGLLTYKGVVAGRKTWYQCDCGIYGPKTYNGVNEARALWNDANLEAHMRWIEIDRHLYAMEAQKGKEDEEV